MKENNRGNKKEEGCGCAMCQLEGILGVGKGKTEHSDKEHHEVCDCEHDHEHTHEACGCGHDHEHTHEADGLKSVDVEIIGRLGHLRFAVCLGGL